MNLFIVKRSTFCKIAIFTAEIKNLLIIEDAKRRIKFAESKNHFYADTKENQQFNDANKELKSHD